MARTRMQKWRVRLSSVAGVVFFGVLGVVTSGWEDRCPSVSAALFFLGLALVGVASLGRLWCSLYIAGHKTRQLVMQGPYAMTRNPLYFFSLVGFAGVGMTSEMVWPALALLGAFALYYPFVIQAEEKRLALLHAEDYLQYTASTPRFFPALNKLREPATYEVNPVIFRQHLFHALTFIWLVGLLELLEELRELHILPICFTGY